MTSSVLTPQSLSSVSEQYTLVGDSTLTKVDGDEEEQHSIEVCTQHLQEANLSFVPLCYINAHFATLYISFLLLKKESHSQAMMPPNLSMEPIVSLL